MAKGKDKATRDDAEPRKPSGVAVKLLVGAALLLCLGAGGAYGVFAAGLLGGGKASEPELPKLVRKGDVDPYAAAFGDKDEDSSVPVYGDGGSEYRTAYYSFDDSFTSNLADSPALIQVDLAVSTRRDGRVLQWVKNHELAIRSAILVQLADTPESDVFDVAGKQKLARRLTSAINAVLEENEGFGGVEAVHFKGFLVQ